MGSKNERVRQLVEGALPDNRAKLAFAIFDIFALALGKPSAALLTAEVLERGLRVFCQQIWDEDEEQDASAAD